MQGNKLSRCEIKAKCAMTRGGNAEERGRHHCGPFLRGCFELRVCLRAFGVPKFRDMVLVQQRTAGPTFRTKAFLMQLKTSQ